MTTLSIHPAGTCPLATRPCRLAISVNGAPACAHPSIGWPLAPGVELPTACPCEAADALPATTGREGMVGRARRCAKSRERWS